jgi:hypothetical protein
MGAVCQICWHAFKASGLSLAHGGLDKYLVFVRTKPQEHRSFMRSVKAYIRTVNDRPDIASAM